MRIRLLPLALALALTAPATLPTGPARPLGPPSLTGAAAAAGDDDREAAGTDGEVRPTLVDRATFAVVELIDRVERLDRELTRLAGEAEVPFAEPYYDGVGEDSVRIAAAVTGRPVGTNLDAATAQALVQAAEDELAPTLALAGVGSAELTRDGLAAAAERLGIDLGEAPFAPATLAQLRAVSDDRLAPALIALGRDPGERVSRDDLAPVVSALGDDPGALTADALARLVAEASFRLAPVAYASGLPHDQLGTRAGLARALTRLGVAYGASVDAGDVDAAIRAATPQLTLSPARALGGSLTFQRVYAPTGDGPLAGYLLRWRTDPVGGVDVEAGFAGSFAGRASVPAAAARRPEAVAVVNGGYWAGGGDPDGLLVRDGRLLSSQETLRDWVRGVRTGFGLSSAGEGVVGRPEFAFHVQLPGGAVLDLDGVDRPVGADEAVLYTHGEFLRRLPDDTVTVVTSGPGSLVRSSSTSFGIAVAGPVDTVPAGRLLVAARGRKAAALRAADGQPAALVVEVGERWQGIDQALSGGPWLLRDGRVPPVDEWRTEGFGAGHTDRRHPRTAIGFDGAGNAAILMVDGRRPGHSVGVSHAGMGELMAALGIRDAVMLDGGGSSQMVVDGRLVNQPCCDATTRAVATALYLRPRP